MNTPSPIRLPEPTPTEPVKNSGYFKLKDYFTPHVLIPFGLFFFLLVPFVYSIIPERIVRHPEGVLVQDPPLQTLPSQPVSFLLKGYTLAPRADYTIRARVIGKLTYKNDLSPLDLALGWQGMSDSSVLDKMPITMINRFYMWPGGNYPITERDIETQSANNHIIPANDQIKAQLDAVRLGHIVTLKGQLGDVSGPNGFSWITSLTRNDTGRGACEVFYVTSVYIEE